MVEQYFVGIDIGGTHIRIAAVSPNGEVLHTHIIRSAVFTGARDPVGTLGDIIVNALSRLDGMLLGICIGFPGTVNHLTGTVYSCPLFPGFANTQVTEPLLRRFGVPVMVVHDVILLMTYDLTDWALEKRSCIIGVYLGTGVGNAIWANGDFIYGKDNVAGELGHTPVFGKTDPCPCGNPGCIELYSSGKLLQKLCAEHFPDTPMDDLFVLHGDSPLFDEYLDAVGAAVSIEINILNPDVILLGGGVFHMKGFPRDRLERAIRLHTRKPFPHDSLRFEMSSNDRFAGAIGAAQYMWTRSGG